MPDRRYMQRARSAPVPADISRRQATNWVSTVMSEEMAALIQCRVSSSAHQSSEPGRRSHLRAAGTLPAITRVASLILEIKHWPRIHEQKNSKLSIFLLMYTGSLSRSNVSTLLGDGVERHSPKRRGAKAHQSLTLFVCVAVQYNVSSFFRWTNYACEPAHLGRYVAWARFLGTKFRSLQCKVLIIVYVSPAVCMFLDQRIALNEWNGLIKFNK